MRNNDAIQYRQMDKYGKLNEEKRIKKYVKIAKRREKHIKGMVSVHDEVL